MNPVPRTTATLSRTQQTPSPSRSNELATGPRRPPPPRDRVRATSAHGWSRGRNEWVWTTTEGRRTRHITDTHMRESTWVGTAEISPTKRQARDSRATATATTTATGPREAATMKRTQRKDGNSVSELGGFPRVYHHHHHHHLLFWLALEATHKLPWCPIPTGPPHSVKPPLRGSPRKRCGIARQQTDKGGCL